jgi:hypothetical protein
MRELIAFQFFEYICDQVRRDEKLINGKYFVSIYVLER